MSKKKGEPRKSSINAMPQAPAAPIPSPAQQLFDRAWEIGNKGDADTCYRMLVSGTWQYPDYADGWFKLAGILAQMKKNDAAIVAYARCADIALREGPTNPLYTKSLTGAGWALHMVGRTEEAAEWLEAAVKIDPSLDIAWENLSQVRLALDDVDASARCAQRALLINPKFEMHRLALSLVQLHDGQYIEGFKNYEARIPLHLKDLEHFPYPLWRGEQLKGKLFIQAEQGIGDAINMLRYVEEAAERADSCIVHVHTELAVLFRQNLPAKIEVVGAPQPLPAVADAYVPMMSIPVALKVTKEDVARTNGIYVKPTLPMAHPGDGRFHVGIVWEGSSAHMANEWRSATLRDFLPLGEVQGVSLNSFQMGPAHTVINSDLAGGFVRNWAPEIANMADTANILAGMDMVISVDTAVVHLAGAMGKECWVLVAQQAADYRWGRTGEETPWYPSLRLFRRELRESWSDVILRVREELHAKVSATRGPLPKQAKALLAHVTGRPEEVL